MTWIRWAVAAWLLALVFAAPASAQGSVPDDGASDEAVPDEATPEVAAHEASADMASAEPAAPPRADARPAPLPSTAPAVPEGYGGPLVLRPPLDPELVPQGPVFTHYKGIRRMAQVGASLLALITAVGFGTGAAAAVCCGDRSTVAGYTTAWLITTLGVGLGVAAAGRRMPPSGSWGWTLLGATIGATLTGAMILGGAVNDFDRVGLFITGNTFFPLLTPLGAIWAYELSAGEGSQQRRGPVRVARTVPTVTFDPSGGATFGLVGSF